MTAGSALRLPPSMVLAEAAPLSRQWEASVAAEAAGVAAAAGSEVQISAAELKTFDSSALSVLLGCARVCAQSGLRLRVEAAPPLLRDLARMYGVETLLWPEVVGASA